MTWNDWVLLSFLIAVVTLPGFSSIAHYRRRDSRFWWELERIRACIACEGDPGPWKEQVK